ncbi:MAG: plastocyanin/azurin family copper-binding protein [Balneolales bacterium]
MKGAFIYIIILFLHAFDGLSTPPGTLTTTMALEQDTVSVFVLGIHKNARFEPATVQIRMGDVVRFEVKEGLHTVTAYHPENRRDLGIPEGADSFDSGILSAGEEWFLTVTVPGEYNYFCLPHELMGHKGKIIAVSDQTITEISN